MNCQQEQDAFFQSEQADAPPLQMDQPLLRKKVSEIATGKIVGASLLCYCVDPTWSRVYFLLGKEKKHMRWRAGSERWSDFGGRASFKAVAAEDIAAKEFVEETLAMVKYFEHDTLPRTGYADIAESLRNGDYTFNLNFGFGDSENPRNYVTFVKQIPWDPQALSRFEECREMLLNPAVHFGTPRWTALIDHNPGIKQVVTSSTQGREVDIRVKRDYLEKKMLGLWSIPQLQHAVECNGVMSKRDGRVERCRGGFMGTVELVLSELSFYQPEVMQETVYGSQ